VMDKDAKIQIRVNSAEKQWLKAYAKKHNITISKMFIDFISWLKNREESKDG